MPYVEAGARHVFATHLRDWLRLTMGERLSAKELAVLMRAAGPATNQLGSVLGELACDELAATCAATTDRPPVHRLWELRGHDALLCHA